MIIQTKLNATRPAQQLTLGLLFENNAWSDLDYMLLDKTRKITLNMKIIEN